jgi:tRNA A37 threonylcarbamoyladenosine biosynthesis protein TsaE
MLQFKPRRCEIISYHSGENQNFNLLGCDAVSLGTRSPTFQRIVMYLSSRLELFNLDCLNLEGKTSKRREHLLDDMASDSRRLDSSNSGCNVVQWGREFPSETVIIIYENTASRARRRWSERSPSWETQTWWLILRLSALRQSNESTYNIIL